jgi:dipeptidase
VDNLLYLRWQEAYKDLRKARDPLEDGFFEELAKMDTQAVELYKKDPAAARELVTDFSRRCMEQAVDVFRKLRAQLITKYTNNRLGL